MSENAIIALCSGIVALTGWTVKILLRLEKRLTRVETKLGTEDENTTVFIKKHYK